MADPRYFGRRKKGTALPPGARGQLYGALITDPAGRAVVLPLDAGEVPTGVGPGQPPIAEVPGGGGSFVPLFDGGEPVQVISDGAGSPILVHFSETP